MVVLVRQHPTPLVSYLGLGVRFALDDNLRGLDSRRDDDDKRGGRL